MLRRHCLRIPRLAARLNSGRPSTGAGVANQSSDNANDNATPKNAGGPSDTPSTFPSSPSSGDANQNASVPSGSSEGEGETKEAANGITGAAAEEKKGAIDSKGSPKGEAGQEEEESLWNRVRDKIPLIRRPTPEELAKREEARRRTRELLEVEENPLENYKGPTVVTLRSSNDDTGRIDAVYANKPKDEAVLLGEEAAHLTDEAIAKAKKEPKLWFWQKPRPEDPKERMLLYASWALLPTVATVSLIFDGITYAQRFSWLGG